jgi:hypothetical protein
VHRERVYLHSKNKIRKKKCIGKHTEITSKYMQTENIIEKNDKRLKCIKNNRKYKTIINNTSFSIKNNYEKRSLEEEYETDWL